MASPSHYAVVGKDGVVGNIIVWNPEFAPTFNTQLGADALIAIGDGEKVEIGYIFDGLDFIPPLAPPAPDPLVVAQTSSIARIESEFTRLQASLYVDASQREALRTAALAGVDAIRTATTEDAVAEMIRLTLSSMDNLAKPT